ncbi:MAG TPA: HmuY family protein [Longimicrobiales bacterium]
MTTPARRGARRYASRRAPFASVLALAGAAGLAACSDEAPLGPGEDSVPTLTVDASQDWAFVELGETASTVSIPDPTASTEWDIAFFKTAVMLNGGAAGPGGVVGHCLCVNAQGATDAELQELTPESKLDAFLAVTAADVPAEGDAWMSDALAPAIDGWYRYDPEAHVVSAASDRVWKLRAAESEAPVYAKFHVIGIEGATQANAGHVTIEFAVQAGKGGAMGEARAAELDLTSGGRVYFDLARGEASDAADWDLAFEGYTIRVNGGVSGSGSAGAVLADASFDAMADASDAPDGVYSADAFGGVFDAHPWYRYDLAGQHQIWPTYDVYLVKRGDAVYKLQLIGYYGADGTPRQVTFRYARLDR